MKELQRKLRNDIAHVLRQRELESASEAADEIVALLAEWAALPRCYQEQCEEFAADECGGCGAHLCDEHLKRDGAGFPVCIVCASDTEPVGDVQ